MARLDSYSKYPSGMEEYLSAYGWHFSKKMCDWAVSQMYRTDNKRKVYIEPITKDKLEELFRRMGTSYNSKYAYDAVYVANMCKADFLGRSIRDDGGLIQYVLDVMEDPDGYEGMVFTRFYADCVGSGMPINWEDML